MSLPHKVLVVLLCFGLLASCTFSKKGWDYSYNPENPIEVYSLFGLNGLKQRKNLNLNYAEKQSIGGYTVLMMATQKNDLETMKYLLSKKNLNLDIKDSDGRAAIDIAKDLGHQEAINMLRNEKLGRTYSLDKDKTMSEKD